MLDDSLRLLGGADWTRTGADVRLTTRKDSKREDP